MGLRTNPDQILENIDRQRSREEEAHAAGQDRQAVGKELETEIPDVDATTPERMKRIFAIVERAYNQAASNAELGKLASHFRAVGDIPDHHAHGDVSVSIQYIHPSRPHDVGMAPLEIRPHPLFAAKNATTHSRHDVHPPNVPRHQRRHRLHRRHRRRHQTSRASAGAAHSGCRVSRTRSPRSPAWSRRGRERRRASRSRPRHGPFAGNSRSYR